MKEINLHNKVLSTDLSVMLGVSEDTVRRDMKDLADAGKIIKVHGGAINKSLVSSFSVDNEVYAKEAKQIIAQKALSLLKNDMVVLCEGGTTLQELTYVIPEQLRLTIFTVSPQVAILLARHANLEVITIGGRLNKNGNVHVGATVINQLNAIRADLCLMGVNALSAEGLTDIDWEAVQVNKAMIENSRKTALLTISEKLNVSKRFKVSELEEIHYLITELEPEDQQLTVYRDSGIRIL